MGIVMLTFNEYTTISNNCSDNKQLSDAINSVCSAALEESSVISHEIKNQAAYLKPATSFFQAAMMNFAVTNSGIIWVQQ